MFFLFFLKSAIELENGCRIRQTKSTSCS